MKLPRPATSIALSVVAVLSLGTACSKGTESSVASEQADSPAVQQSPATPAASAYSADDVKSYVIQPSQVPPGLKLQNSGPYGVSTGSSPAGWSVSYGSVGYHPFLSVVSAADVHDEGTAISASQAMTSLVNAQSSSGVFTGADNKGSAGLGEKSVVFSNKDGNFSILWLKGTLVQELDGIVGPKTTIDDAIALAAKVDQNSG